MLPKTRTIAKETASWKLCSITKVKKNSFSIKVVQKSVLIRVTEDSDDEEEEQERVQEVSETEFNFMEYLKRYEISDQ